MALFQHASRGAIVAAGDPAATGIGVELHFIASGAQLDPANLCHCDDFRIIQVLTTTHPFPPSRGNSYVDNAGTNTPFYRPTGRGGRGEHAIPAGYTDAGERVTTTESIYDRPFRDTATLNNTSLNWMAETCVSCIKTGGIDRILGCVTYGFSRNFNAATNAFDAVAEVSPGCLERPSSNFINILGTDPTTSGYRFRAAPRFAESGELGDFPIPPPGAPRVA